MLSHLLVGQCNIPYNILLVNLLRCGVLHSTKAVLTTVLPVGNIVSLSLVAHQVFEDETVLVTAPLIIEILTFYCVCVVHCLNCFRFRSSSSAPPSSSSSPSPPSLCTSPPSSSPFLCNPLHLSCRLPLSIHALQYRFPYCCETHETQYFSTWVYNMRMWFGLLHFRWRAITRLMYSGYQWTKQCFIKTRKTEPIQCFSTRILMENVFH